MKRDKKEIKNLVKHELKSLSKIMDCDIICFECFRKLPNKSFLVKKGCKWCQS